MEMTLVPRETNQCTFCDDEIQDPRLMRLNAKNGSPVYFCQSCIMEVSIAIGISIVHAKALLEADERTVH